jgi:fructuronate reductase
MDGTQKIPQRWLATIEALRQQGKLPSALLFALAAWLAFISKPGRLIDDPLAAQLSKIREDARGDAAATVHAIIGEQGLFKGALQGDSIAAQQVAMHLDSIWRHGMRQTLHERQKNESA